MKVLFISRDARLAERGPLNDVQLRHIAYAGRLGRLDILVDTPGSHAPSFPLDAKVTVHPVASPAPPAFPTAVLAHWRTLRRTVQPDVITTQDPFLSGLAGFALSKWSRAPLNVQVHSDQLDNPFFLRESAANRLQNRLAKTLLKHTHTLRVVNRHTLEQCRALGVAVKRCFYIPLVFGLEPFFAAGGGKGTRNALLGAASKTASLLLFVGRMSREKGWDLLLEAVRILRKEDSTAGAAFVGDGPNGSKARRLARRWGLEDAVQFLGWKPYGELPRFYAAADVCVVPSRHEGFGRSILEAQAVGRAVVATATAGAADLIREGRTGVTVPVEDAAALSDAIRGLLADAEKRDRLGGLSRKEARERWGAYDLPGELARMFEKTAVMG